MLRTLLDCGIPVSCDTHCSRSVRVASPHQRSQDLRRVREACGERGEAERASEDERPARPQGLRCGSGSRSRSWIAAAGRQDRAVIGLREVGPGRAGGDGSLETGGGPRPAGHQPPGIMAAIRGVKLRQRGHRFGRGPVVQDDGRAGVTRPPENTPRSATRTRSRRLRAPPARSSSTRSCPAGSRAWRRPACLTRLPVPGAARRDRAHGARGLDLGGARVDARHRDLHPSRPGPQPRWLQRRRSRGDQAGPCRFTSWGPSLRESSRPATILGTAGPGAQPREHRAGPAAIAAVEGRAPLPLAGGGAARDARRTRVAA
jgi:hypothetical protein